MTENKKTSYAMFFRDNNILFPCQYDPENQNRVTTIFWY